jgi:outer membrane lipopolysaccharide assembly protein LptE/RlpB
MQRDSDGTPNELQRALLEYTPTDLEEALIEWTREHWPMAARAMVYNKTEGDNMVSGVQGVRSDEGQLVMQVSARVAISERELLIRGIAAILPEWLEKRYGLTPKQ